MTRSGFGERFYRGGSLPPGLVAFQVREGESDLWVAARTGLKEEALASVARLRREVASWGSRHPGFLSSLEPVEVPPGAPGVVREMARAGKAAGVGPMAAVAGAIAEGVARDLSPLSDQVLVENGGDLFLLGGEDRTVALWAGGSPLSGKVGIRVPSREGMAVCTSSGTVGPSLSLGRADAATVLSSSGALADAAATALGNRVRSRGDVEPALEEALAVEGVLGALVIIGDALGVLGDVELCPVRMPPGAAGQGP